MQITIRKLQINDEARWRVLWEGYCHFYKREPSEAITQHLWNRLMDSTGSVNSIVAVNNDNYVIGIANYVVHENTSTLSPVCYLQDIFVDPKARAKRVGRTLMDWLVNEMKNKKWSRLYWNTKEDNYLARILYDSYTPHSGFLKYVMKNDEIL
jgi:ribosomal protein S18 acetylase RimI-like enzyme